MKLIRLNARLPQIKLIAKIKIRPIIRIRIKIRIKIIAKIIIN
jgi:hypothetical protein